MLSQDLATLSNLVLYAAMVVLAFSMLAFAIHLSRLAGAAVPERGAVTERVLTGAGGPEQLADAVPHAPVEPVGDGPGSDVPATGSRVPGAKAGALGMMFGWLGTMLIGFSIALRGLSVQRPPVSNMFEFAVAGTFLVMVIYLVLGLRRPIRWLGLFVVTPVLLILGLAITVWYTVASELVPSLKSTWLIIHVPVAILSTAIFTIAFMVLLLHLIQGRREERLADGLPVRSGPMASLPDAASLDRTAYSLIVIAFPLWTFTLIAGAIWGQQAWGTYWSWDPKEVWTFVIWVIYAAYLHARATSGWSLRTANIIAAIGYLAIICNFTIVNYFLPGMHSYSGLTTP